MADYLPYDSGPTGRDLHNIQQGEEQEKAGMFNGFSLERKLDVPYITADMLYDNAKNPYKHKWCITMKPHGSSVAPPNPYKECGFPQDIIPATGFRLDTYKISEDTISLTDGYDITLPVSFIYNRSLSITFYNEVINQKSILRNWLRKYRSNVFPSYKTTVPYKNSCCEFTIYIYDEYFKTIDKYIYYGIPDLSDPSVSSNVDADRSIDLSIILLGEDDNNPTLKPKG